jgi:hypothetical protein
MSGDPAWLERKYYILYSTLHSLGTLEMIYTDGCISPIYGDLAPSFAQCKSDCCDLWQLLKQLASQLLTAAMFFHDNMKSA